jgi:hypothetical protein
MRRMRQMKGQQPQRSGLGRVRLMMGGGRSGPRQVYNYLRATNLEVGLLLHFGPRPNFYRLISSNRRP